MDANSLTTVLAGAGDPTDPARQKAAENWLAEAEKSNFPLFVQMLTQELLNQTSPPQIKQLAGLVFKNCLTAKEEATRAPKFHRWISIDRNFRAPVKTGILQALASPINEVRSSAAQVASSIAQIELPQNQWPELIPTLLENLSSNNDEFKRASLETIGYVCEEIDPSVLTGQSNAVLTAVCQGIRQNSPAVKLAGCNALYNALEFAKPNFEIEIERNFLMTVICETAVQPDLNLREVAFECIVKVATLYYDKLSPYMQSLFQITMDAIKKDDEKVALQGIEFWSSICDEEIYINGEVEEAIANKTTPERTSQNFIKGAVKYLAPVLTECLTKQEDEFDEDSWNVAMSAGTCLSLVAAAVGDDVVPHVVPFVQQNINQGDWKLREAATMAFGAILEGPSDYICGLIVQALPILMQHMKDENVHVKDTTAWTLGRIVSLHPQTVNNQVNQLITILVDALNDSPRVAANVCWPIHNLAENLTEHSSKPTSPLTPYFGPILQKLMQATERQDSDENNLRSAAYETIGALISAGAKDTNPIVLQALPMFIERLHKTFSMQPGSEIQTELQSSLCGVLQYITQKLGAEIKPFADQLMTYYLQVFNIKSSSVHEEALMAVAALANAIEHEFERYMSSFNPYLLQGLKNFQEYSVCAIAVGVVGDVARALQGKLLPYCDEIMQALLADLQNPQMNRSVKPPIVSCFGDIAMVIGGGFVKYLGATMKMLQGASTLTFDTTNEEMVDYMHQLRESIFEAYTGVIQGLRTDNAADPHLLPYCNAIIALCEVVEHDRTRPESLTKVCLGTIGDLAHALGPRVKAHLNQPFIKSLIASGMEGDEETKTNAQWARDTIGK